MPSRDDFPIPSASTNDATSNRRSPSRRTLLAGSAAAVGTALFGFQRAALAQGDPAARIVQTAAFKLDPAQAEQGLAALRTLTEAVEATEPGVLAYIAHRSKQDPTQIVFFEIYADQAALSAHGQTEHLGELRKLFAAGVFQPPLEIVQLETVGGFYRA